MIIHDAANRVVKLLIGNELCAVRMPRMDDSQLRVDRNSELAALKAAATLNLTPEVMSFDAPSGVMITRWIDDPVWTEQQAHNPEYIRLIARALRRLHDMEAPADVRKIDLEHALNFYWNELAARHEELPPGEAERHQEILDLQRAQPPFIPGLCHNDLHCRNLIGTGAAFRILDWEYACVGKPLFDLASYSESNNLNESEMDLLAEAYGANAQARARLPDQRRLYKWICTLWLRVAGLYKASDHMSSQSPTSSDSA